MYCPSVIWPRFWQITEPERATLLGQFQVFSNLKRTVRPLTVMSFEPCPRHHFLPLVFWPKMALVKSYQNNKAHSENHSGYKSWVDAYTPTLMPSCPWQVSKLHCAPPFSNALREWEMMLPIMYWCLQVKRCWTMTVHVGSVKWHAQSMMSII